MPTHAILALTTVYPLNAIQKPLASVNETIYSVVLGPIGTDWEGVPGVRNGPWERQRRSRRATYKFADGSQDIGHGFLR